MPTADDNLPGIFLRSGRGMTGRRRQRGFSLLELLLAVGIVALIFGAMYRSFSLGLAISQRMENNLNPEAQRVLDYLSRDLRSAFPDQGKARGVNFLGSPQGMQFLATAPLNQRADRTEDLIRVQYRLTPNSDGSLALARLTSSAWSGDEAEEILEKELSGHIQSLKFSYFNGQQWAGSWGEATALPQAVQIKIELKRNAGKSPPQTYSTIVRLPCS